jgi:DNA-binding transcriptional MerR regulator
VRYLKTSEAATLLSVSANTLRSWEKRFDFPSPQRSPGMHRLYLHAELAALQQALRNGLSISSAVSQARRALADHSNSLVDALISYRRERADAAIETALSLRSVESAVEEVLLPALDEIGRRHSHESAAWAFASQWAADWLRRATRLTPPPERPTRIMLGDASRDSLDPDFAYIRAFELFCMRTGIPTMSLSARGAVGIGDAIGVHRPDLVVLAGAYLRDDAVASWANHVRHAAGAIPVVMYRRGDERMQMPMSGALTLPSASGEAAQRLVELLEVQRSRTRIPASALVPDARWSPVSLHTASL